MIQKDCTLHVPYNVQRTMYNVQCKFRTQSLTPDPHRKERAAGKPGLRERWNETHPPTLPPVFPFDSVKAVALPWTQSRRRCRRWRWRRTMPWTGQMSASKLLKMPRFDQLLANPICAGGWFAPMITYLQYACSYVHTLGNFYLIFPHFKYVFDHIKIHHFPRTNKSWQNLPNKKSDFQLG